MAAAALITHDKKLHDEVKNLFNGRQRIEVKHEEKIEIIRSASKTWTLALAADAAGVTKELVLVALAKNYLDMGISKRFVRDVSALVG